MPLEFVNLLGEKISDAQMQARKAEAHQEQARRKKSVDDKSFHKGWRVTGIPPGALEEARTEALRLGRIEEQNGRAAKEFNDMSWIQNHRGKAVRSKPYEIKDSADECAALAEKAGWLRVRVEEIKRDLRKPASGAFT